jgi:nitrous oxide reductase accessory protein NosL
MARLTNAEVQPMKNIIILSFITLLMYPAFSGAMETVEDPKTCTQCGMNRTMFAHSRMLVIYPDESTVGVCSLHCAAEELNNNQDKQVTSLMVADYYTKELMNARTAAWVVGGNIKGVMTAVAKWAFAREEDALKFIAENGGVINSFDQAMNSASKELLDLASEEEAMKNSILRELQ